MSSPSTGVAQFQQAANFTALLSNYQRSISSSQWLYLQYLLNGTDNTSQELLSSLMSNGNLNAIYQSQNHNEDRYLEIAAEQLLYGILLKTAWKISQTPQNPFILYAIHVDDIYRPSNGVIEESTGRITAAATLYQATATRLT
jgi:hypothetical protein